MAIDRLSVKWVFNLQKKSFAIRTPELFDDAFNLIILSSPSAQNKKVRQTEACRTEKYKAPICRYTHLNNIFSKTA